MSTEMLEKIVLESYFELLGRDRIVPSVKHVLRNAMLIIDKNCYDLIYSDIKENISEIVVHNILFKFQHVHKYDGKKFFEAQNVVLDDWFTYQKLLKEGVK